MFPGIIISKAQKFTGAAKKSCSHLSDLSGTKDYSSEYRFCHHFAAAFLSARTSIICPVMDMAISAGVSALISSPTGEMIRSKSRSSIPYSSTRRRNTKAFFGTASNNSDIACWCGKKLCLHDRIIGMTACHNAAIIRVCDRNALIQMVKITEDRFCCIREKSGIRKFRAVVQNDTAELNTCKYRYKLL